MIGRNPIFQRHITEHPGLQLLIVSTHPRFLPQLPCGIAVVVQQPPKAASASFHVRVPAHRVHLPAVTEPISTLTPMPAPHDASPVLSVSPKRPFSNSAA